MTTSPQGDAREGGDCDWPQHVRKHSTRPRSHDDLPVRHLRHHRRGVDAGQLRLPRRPRRHIDGRHHIRSPARRHDHSPPHPHVRRRRRSRAPTSTTPWRSATSSSGARPTDCFVRYKVSEVKPDPTGDRPPQAARRRVDDLRLHAGCSGAVPSMDLLRSASHGASWMTLVGKALTVPVMHGNIPTRSARMGLVKSGTTRHTTHRGRTHEPNPSSQEEFPIPGGVGRASLLQ